MKHSFLTVLCSLMLALTASANQVTVKMNSVSRTMQLRSSATGELVEVGSPTGSTSSQLYTFPAEPGKYELTGFATDGKTVNGIIGIVVSDSIQQQFTIITNTVYATNKKADGSLWAFDEDFTMKVEVSSREGDTIETVPGNSTTAGRKTFLALNGNSYYVTLSPNEQWQAEGYMDLYKSGTLTANVNISGAIPMGADYAIAVDADAEFQLGVKFTHFTNFRTVAPENIQKQGNMNVYNYRLASGQVYNYRAWKEGGLTQAGYFTMNADETKRPALEFPAGSFEAFNPLGINHSVQSNLGYETGDIFVNINPQGYLKMKTGEEFDAHAMRSWELTDNSTNNYFMEPDFHYYVTDLEGKPSTGVIEIDNSDTTTSPWSRIRAVGKGTVIVRVVYDAIGLNYYSNNEKKEYLGGEFWGAIWPENTAVYVISVDAEDSAAEPNMLINEKYNEGMLRLAGKYVDAEHDVFYFKNDQPGALYTFTPENVAEVDIALPEIGSRMLSYNGFSKQGVSKNDDGSYTLTLPEGRSIVRLTDASGNPTYQVLTAKPCTVELINTSRPGSKIYQPGDKVTVQLAGLRHPANKLAGIYNMSAYVTYNDIPNGSSLILSANQYTFGSKASAQAVTMTIPEDFDTADDSEIVMNDGVIQVNGYGDPIGNHRNISPIAGRSPNFTAVPHKTYFGQIPEVRIPVSARVDFDIRILGLADDSKITVTFDGTPLTADADGMYAGTYGDYKVTVATPGYRCYRHTFNIPDDASGLQTFACELEKADTSTWDGVTLAEPASQDGIYIINTGNELAWFASEIKPGNSNLSARLGSDIDLGNYDWTPIGGTSLTYAFTGSFDGDGHTITGLFIDNANATYQALFGYVADASISNLTVEGQISAKQYVGGIAAYMGKNSTIDRCVNNVEISASGNYVGGIAAAGLNTSTLSNSCNLADIKGNMYVAGLLGNAVPKVQNCFSIGKIVGDGIGACLYGSSTTIKDGQVENVFCIKEYVFTKAQTLVTEEQMASGEVAWLLGEAFGQAIGEDAYPVIDGRKVHKVTYTIIDTDEAPVLLSEDEEAAVIYTNGSLPTHIDGKEIWWYEDPELTLPVTEVNADATLYAKVDNTSGIADIDAENAVETERWFGINGIEIPKPQPGCHGIFIRIINGKAQKIRM